MNKSESETEVETPPKKKKKYKQEKLEVNKKKQKAERKTEQSTAARSTTASKWKDGDAFVPGMEWDDVPGNHKWAFIQARREFTRSGTAEAKSYKIDSLKKMLEKAENE